MPFCGCVIIIWLSSILSVLMLSSFHLAEFNIVSFDVVLISFAGLLYFTFFSFAGLLYFAVGLLLSNIRFTNASLLLPCCLSNATHHLRHLFKLTSTFNLTLTSDTNPSILWFESRDGRRTESAQTVVSVRHFHCSLRPVQHGTIKVWACAVVISGRTSARLAKLD